MDTTEPEGIEVLSGNEDEAELPLARLLLAAGAIAMGASVGDGDVELVICPHGGYGHQLKPVDEGGPKPTEPSCRGLL